MPISCGPAPASARGAESLDVEVERVDMLLGTPSFDQPQTWPASAPVMSSGRPSALPTSRIAPRVR